MKRPLALAALCATAVLTCSGPLCAQNRRDTVIIPRSNFSRPEDAGLRAHTNIQLFLPGGVSPDSTQPTGETPSSLGCVYGIVPNPEPGCPKDGKSNPTKGKGVIAIVDAFHYPTAKADLNVFSDTFGLPRANFQQVHVGSKVPPENCDWEVQASIAIQWAHAMAPKAKIVLVEAQSNSYAHLLKAVNKAGAIIAANGGHGEISMSWSSGEFPHQRVFDSHFKREGIVYFASSGNSGGIVQYPASSAYVVGVGGTRVNRSNGDFTNETGWSGSGGGLSVFEKRPGFQDGIQKIVGNARGVPDFSYDADPASGVSVYNTSTASCGSFQWFVAGGTTVSAPAAAGVVNGAGKFKTSSKKENKLVYANLGNSDNFTDVTAGHAGQFDAGPGWDFVTGVGTSLGYAGK